MSAHTAACEAARNGGWPPMYTLSVEAQEAVLDCPDESHDSVRRFLCEKPWQPPWLTVAL